MLTQEQIKALKPGDKLIFVRWGHVLNTSTGNVFTFARWKPDNPNDPPHWKNNFQYWQSQELLDQGNHVHNFGIYDVELFDPEVHKEYQIMNKDILDAERNDFIEKWGA